jgi:hypothetical protein
MPSHHRTGTLHSWQEVDERLERSFTRRLRLRRLRLAVTRPFAAFRDPRSSCPRPDGVVEEGERTRSENPNRQA